MAQHRKELSVREMNSYQGQFAMRLRLLMDQHGLDSTGLAHELGKYGFVLTNKAVQKWARGEAIPSLPTLQAIGRVFHLDDWRVRLLPA